MVADTLMNAVFKIKRSNARTKVCLAIDRPIRPSEVVKNMYGKFSHTHFTIVSRAMIELVQLKVLIVLNPDEKQGRYYDLTSFGKQVREKLAQEQ